MSRGASVGLRMLLALAFSAVAAQGAFATGVIVVTCGKNLGSKDFADGDSHCGNTKKAEGPANTGTEPSPGRHPSSLRNLLTLPERQIMKLKSVQSTVTLELQSTEIDGAGNIDNKATAGGEM